MNTSQPQLIVPYRSPEQTYNMRLRLKEMGYFLGIHYHYSVIGNNRVIFTPVNDTENLMFLFPLIWDSV